MKKKKEKGKKKEPKPALFLPEEHSLSSPESPFGPPGMRRWTGKIGEEYPIAFSVLLPRIHCLETQTYLESLRDSFLFFLQRESEKYREQIWFAGMDFSFEKNILFLKTAFSPFSQRKYFPFAAMTLSDQGQIVSIDLFPEKKKQKEKK